MVMPTVSELNGQNKIGCVREIRAALIADGVDDPAASDIYEIYRRTQHSAGNEEKDKQYLYQTVSTLRREERDRVNDDDDDDDDDDARPRNREAEDDDRPEGDSESRQRRQDDLLFDEDERRRDRREEEAPRAGASNGRKGRRGRKPAQERPQTQDRPAAQVGTAEMESKINMAHMREVKSLIPDGMSLATFAALMRDVERVQAMVGGMVAIRHILQTFMSWSAAPPPATTRAASK